MHLTFILCMFIQLCWTKIIDKSNTNYLKKSHSLEQVTSTFGLSEGPHWDVHSQKLYFVQIWKQHICSYNPATGEVFYAFIKNGPVSLVTTVEGEPGKLLATSGTDIVLVTWNGENNDENPEIKLLISVEKGKKGFRFNDGKVDAIGRLWAGTMCQIDEKNIPEVGSLYIIDEKLDPKVKISSVSISNGLEWSKDNKNFYFIDTTTNKVFAYDFDLPSGNISNKRIIIDVKEKGFQGFPDGMTIDTDGNLWIALVHGSKLIRVDPENGKVLKVIDFPTKMVTSVAFGGVDLDILYVTTASYDFPTKIIDAKGGTIFALKNLGVKGYPPNSFKLNKQF
ncbi:regucalcin-like isoform X1 [Leptopilina boulardi]|uniref:regucalcin-like isoform X1 n=1 Tax=Leptopilina boulardi TaxID=63433 RepID=UPI0021F5671C|nr:regucalcin-like isoform X1 [Leptopilina boulardi]XP_051161843.1 regucalcin-like isoform X1 [Leptopilina boulardi]